MDPSATDNPVIQKIYNTLTRKQRTNLETFLNVAHLALNDFDEGQIEMAIELMRETR